VVNELKRREPEKYKDVPDGLQLTGEVKENFDKYVQRLAEDEKHLVSADDVKNIENLFRCGMWTGNYLPIARLIEWKFGKGKFRELAENTTSDEKFVEYVKNLN